MRKKILIVIFLLFGLLAVPGVLVLSTQPVFADTTGGSNPPPSGDVSSGAFMFDLSSITHTAIKGTTRQSWIREGINYFFTRIISVMATLIGSFAVLMMSIGGFLMLSSHGDETQFEKGRNYAKFALIGLGVTLSAYILVTLVQLLIKSIYGT